MHHWPLLIIFLLIEGLLVPAPYYGSFLLDLRSRSRVVPFPVELSSKVSKGIILLLDRNNINKYKKSVKNGFERNTDVSGNNIHNPSSAWRKQ